MMMLDLDLPEISKLCLTNKRFNDILCNNPLFWRKKLEKEYPMIDISNVKDYKGLYTYLKRKAKKGRKWGDISPNGFKVYGSGGMDYSILSENRSELDIADLEKAAVTFPTYPPEYFSNFGTNAFVLGYKKVQEAIKNLSANVSFISGNFGEKYPILFKFNLDESRVQPILKYLKISYSSHVVRFKNGRIEFELKQRTDLM
jgi:hypothetical protein